MTNQEVVEFITAINTGLIEQEDAGRAARAIVDLPCSPATGA